MKTTVGLVYNKSKNVLGYCNVQNLTMAADNDSVLLLADSVTGT